MQKRGKKGLSMVVTSLILILLVLVAIGIIWAVVYNLIKEGAENVSLDGFTVSLEIKSAKVYDNGDITANVKRTSGAGELSGLMFIFSDGENKESLKKEEGLSLLQEKMFNEFDIVELNKTHLKTLSIAPIFKTESGGEKIGNILDTYQIQHAGSAGKHYACVGGICILVDGEGVNSCNNNSVCGSSGSSLGHDPSDTDNDGLPDSFEQDIIDANLTDNITLISQVKPGDDFDNDGLTNLEEYENDTDPTNPDSDNDGMEDGWEVDNHLNPNSAGDAGLDNDNDGFTNLEEFTYSTNPNSASSYPVTQTSFSSSVQENVLLSVAKQTAHNSVKNPSVTADGKKMVYSKYDYTKLCWDLWLRDTVAETEQKIGDCDSGYTGERGYQISAISNDGSKIIYFQTRQCKKLNEEGYSGYSCDYAKDKFKDGIGIMNADGSNKQHLIDMPWENGSAGNNDAQRIQFNSDAGKILIDSKGYVEQHIAGTYEYTIAGNKLAYYLNPNPYVSPIGGIYSESARYQYPYYDPKNNSKILTFVSTYPSVGLSSPSFSYIYMGEIETSSSDSAIHSNNQKNLNIVYNNTKTTAGGTTTETTNILGTKSSSPSSSWSVQAVIYPVYSFDKSLIAYTLNTGTMISRDIYILDLITKERKRVLLGSSGDEIYGHIIYGKMFFENVLREGLIYADVNGSINLLPATRTAV
ncbi:MAG: hypothetical protein KKA64_03675 [Nanoarchaeota archaeon]|nr:hypothetical protein [Nanoarchaeota archaeon]